jgi:hypothetical protein
MTVYGTKRSLFEPKSSLNLVSFVVLAAKLERCLDDSFTSYLETFVL